MISGLCTSSGIRSTEGEYRGTYNDPGVCVLCPPKHRGQRWRRYSLGRERGEFGVFGLCSRGGTGDTGTVVGEE